MLKFFHTIRKNLREHLPVGQAGDNVQKPVSSAGRYLLCAIGEILLVENMYERVGNMVDINRRATELIEKMVINE